MANRRALITGGTRGIGWAIAEALADDGFDVVLNYHSDPTRANAAAARLRDRGVDSQAVRADVTVEEQVRDLVEETLRDGPLDLLVNNVGDFLMRPFTKTSLEEWHHVLDSNLTSTFLCCREILPHMRQRKSGQIINIASMHAENTRATPNTLAYAIAKSGIVSLTKSLAKSEAAAGLRINAVCPGFVEGGDHTPAEIGEDLSIGRAARPSEIASAVAFLASDRASYITGAVLNVHGGALL